MAVKPANGLYRRELLAGGLSLTMLAASAPLYAAEGPVIPLVPGPEVDSFKEAQDQLLVKDQVTARSCFVKLPKLELSWTTMLASLASPPASGLTHALRPELKHLRAPTLFVWGDKDVEPARLGQEMAALAPHARCEVVADTGHIVWLDRPKRCSKLTIEFLKSG
jgi:pimeloyl-ACP methyl ester carboxylesterase